MITSSTNLLLADTSALSRLAGPGAAALGWDEAIANGLVGVCAVTELELLFGARSTIDRTRMLESLRVAYTWVLMPDEVYDRARQVQELLAQRGKHRSAGPVDLLVAATAELTSRTLLHYDSDFEAIAGATGQAAQWLAPPGSID